MARDRHGNHVCGKCGAPKEFTPYDYCGPCMNVSWDFATSGQDSTLYAVRGADGRYRAPTRAEFDAMLREGGAA